MLVIPPPKITAVIQGLLDAIVNELALNNDSLLKSILNEYSLTLNTTISGGERIGLLFGDRVNPPDGLTICFLPMEKESAWDTGPDGEFEGIRVDLMIYWKDHPAKKMTDRLGTLYRFFVDFTEGLEKVLGPDNLGASGGGWSVGGGILMNPWISTAELPGKTIDDTRIKRHEDINYARMIFTGEKYPVDP